MRVRTSSCATTESDRDRLAPVLREKVPSECLPMRGRERQRRGYHRALLLLLQHAQRPVVYQFEVSSETVDARTPGIRRRAMAAPPLPNLAVERFRRNAPWRRAILTH